MLDNTIQLKRLSSTSTDSDTLRIVVFNLSIDSLSVEADFLFALPIAAVLKAIPCPPINWVVDSSIGMTEFDSQNVTVLDLRQHFFGANTQKQELQDWKPVTHSDRFLILLRTKAEELCGIPVAHPPSLTDIPLSTIRPVPLSYRQAAGLSLASHMAIINETETKKPVKVFLLGMNNIIAQNLNQTLTSNR